MIFLMTKSLLFVDKILNHRGLFYYSACELNRSIHSRKTAFPFRASILGVGKHVDVDRMAFGKRFALRSGSFGTQAVIDGIVMPRASKTEALKSRIENRQDITLRPSINKEYLPIFVGSNANALPARAIHVVLRSEGENLFSAYLPLLKLQNDKSDRDLRDKFEQKLQLPCPTPSFHHEYDLDDLARHVLTDGITLPIALKQTESVVLGAAIVHDRLDNQMWCATLFSSDAAIVIQKDSEVFCLNDSGLLRVAKIYSVS